MDRTCIEELRAVDPLRFRQLALKAFPKFLANFHIKKEWPFKDGYNFIITAGGEKDLVHIRQDRLLIDSGLIRKLYDISKIEKLNRIFLITTGVVSILDKSFLEDKPVETIDARRLAEFLSITLGEEGLRKELDILKERRKYPRLDLNQGLDDMKVDLKAETLYQTRPGIGELVKDISAAGIRLNAASHMPFSNLLRLELFLRDSPIPIKVLAKTIWQRERFPGINEAGLLFFLIKDNDRKRITEFIRVKKVDSEIKPDDNKIDSDSHRNSLLELLVKKGILKRKYLNLEERGIEMDIEKVNSRAQRFLRKIFQRKSKIVDTHKVESGWEVWAKVIDESYRKLGYRNVYEKNIYIVKLDENFKVLGYTVASGKHPLKEPVPVDKAIIEEIIKKIVKETLPKKEADSQLLKDIAKEMSKERAAIDINPEALKRIAKEVASRVSSAQGESKLKGKPQEEDIEIRESFINPAVETKMKYNFNRLGRVAKSSSKIAKQVKSFRSIKKKKKKVRV